MTTTFMHRTLVCGCLIAAALAASGWGAPARAEAPAVAAPAANTLGPQELVENSAKRMLEELDAHRDRKSTRLNSSHRH